MASQKIVDGILYDIYKADEIASVYDGQEKLYRGKNGNCFLVRFEYVDEIYPVTQEEAIEWLQEHNKIEEAVETFGIEEA